MVGSRVTILVNHYKLKGIFLKRGNHFFFMSYYFFRFQPLSGLMKSLGYMWAKVELLEQYWLNGKSYVWVGSLRFCIIVQQISESQWSPIHLQKIKRLIKALKHMISHQSIWYNPRQFSLLTTAPNTSKNWVQILVNLRSQKKKKYDRWLYESPDYRKVIFNVHK